MDEPSHTAGALWPALPYELWQPTCTTLHLWLQVAGKVRLALTPWWNHSWHATFYVTAEGLTSSPIYDGRSSFQLDFDFLNHELRIATSAGNQRQIPLVPQSVADFHGKLPEAFADLAVRRFSSRRAPLHPSGVPGLPGEVTREAYSHEVSSAGFWPGSGIGYPSS